MSFACMFCGAAGARELFLSILVIFLCMFAVLNGDWRDTDTRNRPLEAEREAGHG
jgi:hypothetical protein